MNRMQGWLARAAKELELRVEISYNVTLSDGRTLVSQALFLELGNPRGTLVFDWKDEIDNDVRHDLTYQGYGVSTFSEPLPSEVFDIDGYAEMFAEWGWAGKADQKPAWMIESDRESNRIHD